MTPITRNPRTPLSMRNRLIQPRIQRSRRMQTTPPNNENHKGLKEIVKEGVMEALNESLKKVKQGVHEAVQDKIKDYIKGEIKLAVDDAIESTIKETVKEYVEEEFKVAVEAMKSVSQVF